MNDTEKFNDVCKLNSSTFWYLGSIYVI